MAMNATTPRTRRAVIASAIGGTVALAAGAIGQPEVARAGSDGDVVLGQMNTSGTSTIVRNTSAGGYAVQGQASAATGTSIGVAGSSKSPAGVGVYGVIESTTGGIGVWGEANSSGGVGVYGAGDTYAVRGAGASTGVFGSTGMGTGVIGWSQNLPMGTDPHPTTPAKTGVYGYAAHDAAAMGVYGQSTTGRGVQGVATSGFGVRAAATTGTGAYVTASTGTAVYATATTSGYALRTSGRVSLERASGVATIAATKTTVVVTPGLDVTTTSFVLLTPKGSLGGRDLWYTTDAAANTITIRVSSAVTASLAVGWLLLG